MNEPRNTGSEEEQNPYDLKELFIEACAREWREEYFSEIVGRNGLEAMSMLDSLEDLEVGAPLYSGPDLFTSLQHDVSSRSREKWLFKEVCLALQDPYLRTAIDTLLDKDLEAAGMLSLMGLGKRLADKARALVNYRLKRKISSIHQSNQSTSAGAKKAFMVTLKTLIGGHGGLLKEINLYFSYGTTFQVFLIILRDATKLSTIPPIDLDEKTSAKRELSSDTGSDTTSQTSSTHYGRHVQQRSSDKGSEMGSESSSGAHSPLYSPVLQGGPKPQPKPRSSSARGYTIADGPWLYRFKCERQSGKGSTYVEIKDEQSYLKMVDNFQDVTSKDPSTKYTILLIHSIDRIASQKWREKEREDENAEQNFREKCRRELESANPDAFDDNSYGESLYEYCIGESYSEWLRKDIASQKQKQNTQKDVPYPFPK